MLYDGKSLDLLSQADSKTVYQGIPLYQETVGCLYTESNCLSQFSKLKRKFEIAAFI